MPFTSPTILLMLEVGKGYAIWFLLAIFTTVTLGWLTWSLNIYLSTPKWKDLIVKKRAHLLALLDISHDCLCQLLEQFINTTKTAGTATYNDAKKKLPKILAECNTSHFKCFKYECVRNKIMESETDYKTKIDFSSLDITVLCTLLFNINKFPLSIQGYRCKDRSCIKKCCSNCEHTCMICRKKDCGPRKCCIKKHSKCNHKCKCCEMTIQGCKDTYLPCCKTCKLCSKCAAKKTDVCNIKPVREAVDFVRALRNILSHSSTNDFNTANGLESFLSNFPSCTNWEELLRKIKFTLTDILKYLCHNEKCITPFKFDKVLENIDYISSHGKEDVENKFRAAIQKQEDMFTQINESLQTIKDGVDVIAKKVSSDTLSICIGIQKTDCVLNEDLRKGIKSEFGLIVKRKIGHSHENWKINFAGVDMNPLRSDKRCTIQIMGTSLKETHFESDSTDSKRLQEELIEIFHKTAEDLGIDDFGEHQFIIEDWRWGSLHIKFCINPQFQNKNQAEMLQEKLKTRYLEFLKTEFPESVTNVEINFGKEEKRNSEVHVLYEICFGDGNLPNIEENSKKSLKQIVVNEILDFAVTGSKQGADEICRLHKNYNLPDSSIIYLNGPDVSFAEWGDKCFLSIQNFGEIFNENKIQLPKQWSQYVLHGAIAKSILECIKDVCSNVYLFTRYDLIKHVKLCINELTTMNKANLPFPDLLNDESLLDSSKRMILFHQNKNLILNIRLCDDEIQLPMERKNGESDLTLLNLINNNLLKNEARIVKNIIVATYSKGGQFIIIDPNGKNNNFQKWFKTHLAITSTDKTITSFTNIPHSVFEFMITTKSSLEKISFCPDKKEDVCSQQSTQSTQIMLRSGEDLVEIQQDEVVSQKEWLSLFVKLQRIRGALLRIMHNANNDPSYEGLPKEPKRLFELVKMKRKRGRFRNKILFQNGFCSRNEEADSSKFDISTILMLIRSCTKISKTYDGTIANNIAAYCKRAKKWKTDVTHYGDFSQMKMKEYKVFRDEGDAIYKGLTQNTYPTHALYETHA